MRISFQRTETIVLALRNDQIDERVNPALSTRFLVARMAALAVVKPLMPDTSLIDARDAPHREEPHLEPSAGPIGTTLLRRTRAARWERVTLQERGTAWTQHDLETGSAQNHLMAAAPTSERTLGDGRGIAGTHTVVVPW
jgi:hypothetical protein